MDRAYLRGIDLGGLNVVAGFLHLLANARAQLGRRFVRKRCGNDLERREFMLNNVVHVTLSEHGSFARARAGRHGYAAYSLNCSFLIGIEFHYWDLFNSRRGPCRQTGSNSQYLHASPSTSGSTTNRPFVIVSFTFAT